MSEDDDRRARRKVGHIPLELLVAKEAQSFRLKIHDVDETDNMDTTMVEAVPAVSLFAVAVVSEVTSRAVVEHVVLAGDVVDTLDLDVLEKLGGGVELLGLGQVGNVAGVNDEG